jgi:hypothetical protein
VPQGVAAAPRSPLGLVDTEGKRLSGGEREAEALAEGVRDADCEREGLALPVGVG